MNTIYVCFEKTAYRTSILRVYKSREKAKAYLDSHAEKYASGSPEDKVSKEVSDFDTGHYGIKVNEFTAEAGDCWTYFGFEKCKIYDTGEKDD